MYKVNFIAENETLQESIKSFRTTQHNHCLALHIPDIRNVLPWFWNSSEDFQFKLKQHLILRPAWNHPLTTFLISWTWTPKKGMQKIYIRKMMLSQTITFWTPNSGKAQFFWLFALMHLIDWLLRFATLKREKNEILQLLHQGDPFRNRQAGFSRHPCC